MTTYRFNLLWRMMRRRGLYAINAMAYMECSRPTFKKYMNNPELMNALQRKKLAGMLSVDVAIIDNICNGQIENNAHAQEKILEMVQPLKRQKNEDTD